MQKQIEDLKKDFSNKIELDQKDYLFRLEKNQADLLAKINEKQNIIEQLEKKNIALLKFIKFDLNMPSQPGAQTKYVPTECSNCKKTDFNRIKTSCHVLCLQCLKKAFSAAESIEVIKCPIDKISFGLEDRQKFRVDQEICSALRERFNK